jgi:hypothetical protein
MPYQFYCPQGHLLEGQESQAGQQSQCPLCGSVFLVPPAPGSAPPAAAFSPGSAVPQPTWPGFGQPAAAYGPQPAPGFGPPLPEFNQISGYSQQPVQHYPPYPGASPVYPSGYGAPPGQFPPAGPMPDYGQAPLQPFVGVPLDGPPAVAPNAGAAGATSPVSDPAAGRAVTGTESEQQPADAPTAAAAAPSPTAPEERKEEPRIVRIPCPQGHELQTPTDMLEQDVLCPICGTQFHLRYEDSVDFKQERAELQRQKAEQLNRAALKWSIVTAVVIVLGIIGMIIYLAVRTPGDKTHHLQQSSAVRVPGTAMTPRLTLLGGRRGGGRAR